MLDIVKSLERFKYPMLLPSGSSCVYENLVKWLSCLNQPLFPEGMVLFGGFSMMNLGTA